MAGRIEISDRSYLVDPRKNDGPRLCEFVTSWGVLASPTPSKKDFYSGEKNIAVAQATSHFFCQKTDSLNTPNVLVVKLFADPLYNPQGLPVSAYAEMTPNEHFAEWRMDAHFSSYEDSYVILHRVPNDQIWFQHVPPIAPLLTPWRVIYNIIKYGWQP